eukprot:jgi/Mesvir1/26078/Mv26356-RA.1
MASGCTTLPQGRSARTTRTLSRRTTNGSRTPLTRGGRRQPASISASVADCSGHCPTLLQGSSPPTPPTAVRAGSRWRTLPKRRRATCARRPTRRSPDSWVTGASPSSPSFLRAPGATRSSRRPRGTPTSTAPALSATWATRGSLTASCAASESTTCTRSR